MSVGHACPICAGLRAAPILSLKNQPVLIGVLWPDAESARACRTGDIDLFFCPDCGFLWNASFDPDRIEYDQNYDNSLHFSSTFQSYSKALVNRLFETYQLQGKTIVDIGCGKGDFLAMLCEAGARQGYGFDPAYEGERIDSPAVDRITWSNDFYSEAHAAIQADLLASRFVYEHVPSPLSFLKMIRRSITDSNRTVVFFEVPDADLIIRQFSVWDVIYEHCSYFTLESLSRAFTICGFEVMRIEETYGKQFLTIEAKAATVDRNNNPNAKSGDLPQLQSDVAAFRERQNSHVSHWRTRLDSWVAQEQKVVAWGAGAKAVGFLNMLQDCDVVTRVVDINPHKHGKHIAGTGQPIVPPGALIENPPDIVIVMNPIYLDEIAEELTRHGLSPDLITV